MFESKQGDFEGSASRSEVAILTLQKEKQDSAGRIMELESRLRLVDKDNNFNNFINTNVK